MVGEMCEVGNWKLEIGRSQETEGEILLYSNTPSLHKQGVDMSQEFLGTADCKLTKCKLTLAAALVTQSAAPLSACVAGT